MSEPVDDHQAWLKRALPETFIATQCCPSCWTRPGAQHFIPCPLDRGVWPCMEWREQPGPGGAGKCECSATFEQHRRWRQ